MNLGEILGFQPKGVATSSFSSRKRPAYAGMTGTVQYDWYGGWICLVSPSPLIPLPSMERGIDGWFVLFRPRHTPPLWIDESLITLCQRARL